MILSIIGITIGVVLYVLWLIFECKATPIVDNKTGKFLTKEELEERNKQYEECNRKKYLIVSDN